MRRLAGRGGSRTIAAQRPVAENAPPALRGLRGVGPELARKLATVGIVSARDLVMYFPRDYRDWRTPIPARELTALVPREGEAAEAIAIGTIVAARERRSRFPLITADIADETGSFVAKWFGRRHLFGKLQPGSRIFVYGRVTRIGFVAELNVLQHRILPDDESYRGAIVPVYPATKELPSRQIQTAIARNLDALVDAVPDVLPPAIERRFAFSSVRDALRAIHAPASPEAASAARERLIFEEFFSIALAAALKRSERARSGGAPPLELPADLLETFEAQLPFALTAAQRRVLAGIWHDMTRSAPMNRLLQGDVGSGKTLVAAGAIALAARNGMQSALMAPTEILAAQHAQKLAPLLMPFGITVEALFGSQRARVRAGAVERIGSGAAALAVGTHALLTESVAFARLGLVIIDEQHRFGVAQRAKLRSKSTAPHTLYMTATPIPRTLAQTRYADLDLSIIDELPPGRTPVQTFVLRESRKPQAYAFVRKNIEAGRQAYIVAPAIDESEAALTSAIAEAEHLERRVFPDLRVALVHGRLPSREKDDVMQRFARGEIDALIATTVVEVGVDVANASVMVILDAHRYGLAQLHQLRGRVGRGVDRSFCVLIAPDDAGEIERLEILARSSDGFAIAEEDLRLRREGEFAGTAQAGVATGLVGNVVTDFALYMKAKAEADAIVAADPELTHPEHGGLRGLIDSVRAARALLVSS